MSITAVIIAHDQRQLVEKEAEVMDLFSGIPKDKVILVDNGSIDGTTEWMQRECQNPYIIYDEGIQSYAKILNDVIREFEVTDHLLVLSPKYIVLPNAVQRMERVLNDKIGAVSANTLKCDKENGCDYISSVEQAKNSEDVNMLVQQLDLDPELVLINSKLIHKIGMFEEKMVIPKNVMRDYFFTAVCNGFELMLEQNSVFFENGESMNYYYSFFDRDIDRGVMKEKWQMNYFNDHPNENIMNYIDEEPQKEFNMLEVGCDCGVNLLAVKNKYPNAHLYGVEINPGAARIAAHLADVQVGNIEDKALDFGDVKFDYIMFGDVLEHLRDPEGTINYCKSLLKENGYIISCIPNLMHYTVMHQILAGDFTYTDLGLLDRTHIHFFTYKEIVKMFNRCGYEIELLDSVLSTYVLPKEEEEFINKLVEMNQGAQPFMFIAFQYLVKAKRYKGR